MLVCLVTANSVLAEEEEDTTTESNQQLSQQNSTETEVLLKGTANTTDLIEDENANSTQLGREARKIIDPSLGEYFETFCILNWPSDTL